MAVENNYDKTRRDVLIALKLRLQTLIDNSGRYSPSELEKELKKIIQDIHPETLQDNTLLLIFGSLETLSQSNFYGPKARFQEALVRIIDTIQLIVPEQYIEKNLHTSSPSSQASLDPDNAITKETPSNTYSPVPNAKSFHKIIALKLQMIVDNDLTRDNILKELQNIIENVQPNVSKDEQLSGIIEDLKTLFQADHTNEDIKKQLKEILNTRYSNKTLPIKIVMRALNDKASEVDLLGFSVYAQALSDFIENKHTEKPLTIGIDATWGRGKTTLMHMMEKLLEKSCKVVWFNAWKYDKEETLWAALALEILKQVQQKSSLLDHIRLWMDLNYKRFDWDGFGQKLLKSLSVAFIIGLLCILIFSIAAFQLGGISIQYIQELIRDFGGIGALIAIVYATTKAAFERIIEPFDLKISQYLREPQYKEKVGFFGEFEEDFRNVVASVTRNGKHPLVIFIDDLDRCEPSKSVEVMEAINILLDTEYCVFVLAMDTQIISANIATKYKELKEYFDNLHDERMCVNWGRYFLEKIIQINFRIPKFDRDSMNNFVKSNLEMWMERENKLLQHWLRNNETEKIQENIESKGEIDKKEVNENIRPKDEVHKDEAKITHIESQDVFVQSFDASEEVRDAIQGAIPYLDFNPRKIKRFINVFRLQAFIANRRNLLAQNLVRLDILSKWLVIATRWPDVVNDGLNFINRLFQAHTTREKLKISPNENGSLKAKLDSYLEDQQIKRFINSTELICLIEEIMNISDIETLEYYPHLAQIGTEVTDPIITVGHKSKGMNELKA